MIDYLLQSDRAYQQQGQARAQSLAVPKPKLKKSSNWFG
jgi:hypothetical protein